MSKKWAKRLLIWVSITFVVTVFQSISEPLLHLTIVPEVIGKASVVVMTGVAIGAILYGIKANGEMIFSNERSNHDGEGE